ncbi:MAG: restriction endonuclease [Candidatus Rokuibacteriota bacterium]|jgi:restriction system protein
MANRAVVIPTFDQLMNPTLAALHALGGSAAIPELVERVIADLRCPREVVEQPHGDRGGTELEYRLAWARTYLKKYGLLDNSSRAIWSLTPKGLETKAVAPQEVVKSVRAMFAERKTRKEAEGAGERDIAEVEETGEVASWREMLLTRLLTMPPASFERLCMRVLRESGFIQVEVTGRTGDGGIDGYGVVRLVGMLSFRVSFQCKRYRDNVSSSVVRDFRGAMMGRAEKGLIITTSGFTRDARQEATRDGATAIDLIDGELLADKLKELGLGVRTKMVEAVEIDDDWFSSV